MSGVFIDKSRDWIGCFSFTFGIALNNGFEFHTVNTALTHSRVLNFQIVSHHGHRSSAHLLCVPRNLELRVTCMLERLKLQPPRAPLSGFFPRQLPMLEHQ